MRPTWILTVSDPATGAVATMEAVSFDVFRRQAEGSRKIIR
jgi:hypothetical protein